MSNNNIVFGPIPSRRLGRSIGINNIPPKFCTYACMYCQLGKAIKMTSECQQFYKPTEIMEQVHSKISKTNIIEEKIDYLTLVPDGEPTLDINLHELISMLKSTGVKVAVISNGSLLWKEDVRKALLKADLVSVKVDTIDKEIWRMLNRPVRELSLEIVLKGIETFANEFNGKLVTETMLIKNLNDNESHLTDVALFLKKINPDISYISIPTRPPADKRAEPTNECKIINAFNIFCEHVKHVEYLIGYEGNAFTSTGNVKEDLLSITAVHPMRKDAVDKFLKSANADWSLIEEMLKEGVLVENEFEGHTFVMRKLDTS